MFAWFLNVMIVMAATTPSKGALYQQGMQAIQQQQYDRAQRSFQQLLSILQKEQKQHSPGTEAWHLMTLGQCDVLFHLANIAWSQKDKRRSCRTFQLIETRRKSLPSGWRKWSINPQLPGRIRQAQKALKGQCASVGSLVLLDVTPKTSTVMRQTQTNTWVPVRAMQVVVKQGALVLRVKAKGYETLLVRKDTIPKWSQTTWSISLRALPKPQPRPRLVGRTPPPSLRRTVPPNVRGKLGVKPTPPPFYKTWWFWTITGVAVTAITVTAVVVVTQPNYAFTPTDDKELYRIW